MVDATLGMGGHTLALLARHPQVHIDAVDIDASVMRLARARITKKENEHSRVSFHCRWYDEFFDTAIGKKKHCYRAILIDAGLSLYHFKGSGRGFSHSTDEPLDMRLDVSYEEAGNEKDGNSITAAEIVQHYDEDALAKIFFRYGDLLQARKWAKRIVAYRRDKKLATTSDLRQALQLGKKNRDALVLARVFQAIRIEVNRDLSRLETALPLAWELLCSGGRLAVISFHSGEDRIVKHFAQTVCGSLKKKKYRPIIRSSGECDNATLGRKNGVDLTKKPLRPSVGELLDNPASRSAKLRVMQKTAWYAP